MDRRSEFRDVAICLASAKDRTTAPAFQLFQTGESLNEHFRTLLTDCCDDHLNDGVSVQPYSIDYAPSSHTLQFIDLDTYPQARSRINSMFSPGDLDTFRQDNSFVKHLRFYGIVAHLDDGERVVGLRSINAAQKPNYGKKYIKALYNHTFDVYEEVTDDPFLFDTEIDCLVYRDFVFIRNKDKFQTIFNFYQILEQAARTALSTVGASLQISNFEEFERACLRDPRKQNRLASIANAGDLSQFTPERAQEVANANPDLASILQYDDGQAILVYDPRRPWDLLRFLNETTVISIVTGNTFEADDKRRL